MKILITGSNGMLGNELKKSLKQKKHTIIEFNKSEGNDILSIKQLNHLMKKIDIVIHLAAKLDGEKEEIFRTNVDGTRNVLESAIKHKVKKFIFLSSTGVYGEIGNNTYDALDENSEKSPITYYEKSKLDAENLVLSKQEEIDVRIIRSSLILGNNKYWKNMFKLLKKGFPLPVNGKNWFSIIYVKDLVNAILVVIENGRSSEVYLVSGKEKITLKEFCKITKRNLCKNSFVFSIPKKLAIFIGKFLKIKELNEENIRHLSKNRNYNITKIEKIGYIQKYSLEEAIIKTIKEMNI